MGYEEACRDVENVWDDVKELPPQVNDELNEISCNNEQIVNSMTSLTRALEPLPKFELKELDYLDSDPLKWYNISEYERLMQVFYQRTIFCHCERAARFTWNWLRMKWINFYRKRARLLVDSNLDEIHDHTQSISSHLETAWEHMSEWKDGIDNLAHAFHALPAESDLEEEYNDHSECYTEDDVDEARSEGYEEGKNEAENNPDAAKFVFEIGGWEMLEAIQDTDAAGYDKLRDLWCYAARGNDEEKVNHHKRYVRQLVAMQDVLAEITPEQRRVVLDFLETHFESIEEYLTNEYDL